jgi:hypothetical protein
MSSELGLMSLSEELLLNIFQHLPDGLSVLNLGAACTRLAASPFGGAGSRWTFPRSSNTSSPAVLPTTKGKPAPLSREPQVELLNAPFLNIFGGLECVGHSFAYVAHLRFLRDFWIRTQSDAVASWRATDLATHPSAQCSSTILFSDPESNRIGCFLAYIENAFYLC